MNYNGENRTTFIFLFPAQALGVTARLQSGVQSTLICRRSPEMSPHFLSASPFRKYMDLRPSHLSTKSLFDPSNQEVGAVDTHPIFQFPLRLHKDIWQLDLPRPLFTIANIFRELQRINASALPLKENN